MTARTRVPRASLAVSLLQDAAYIALMRTSKGRAAFGTFVGLLLLAKNRESRRSAQRARSERAGDAQATRSERAGDFEESPKVLAAELWMTSRTLLAEINLIERTCRENGNDPWIVAEDGIIRIRQFEKWNTPQEGWGGSRPGAGRKASDSSCIQLDTHPLKVTVKGFSSSGDWLKFYFPSVPMPVVFLLYLVIFAALGGYLGTGIYNPDSLLESSAAGLSWPIGLGALATKGA